MRKRAIPRCSSTRKRSSSSTWKGRTRANSRPSIIWPTPSKQTWPEPNKSPRWLLQVIRSKLMDDVFAARVRLLGVTVRESACSEQEIEEDLYAQGLLEGRRRGCGRGVPARRGRVRRLRRQSAATARGVPPWRGDRAKRNTGDHRHPEEGSRRCLRQRLDTDPQPGCPRRREHAIHPGLPRSHAYHTGEACHPHRDEDLANPTALLRVEADPLRTNHGGGDTVERGIRHLPGDRHLCTVPHELRPGIRGLQYDPGPGE